MPEIVDDEVGPELALRGTRFARDETEAAYGAWHVSRTIALIRAGGVASLAAWLLLLVPAYLALPDRFVVNASAIVGVTLPTVVLCYALTLRTEWHRWARPALAFATSCSGFLAVAIGVLNDMPAVGLAGTVSCAWFATHSVGLSTKQAAAAVLPYVTAEQLAVIRDYQAARVSLSELAMYSAIPWVTVLVALVGCAVLERTSRQTFRQERIIEAQRVIIARERARTESLLEQEVAHQVAARSRELGRMLAKVDATLLPTRPVVGARFDTRYRIERELGAGAMGAVYEVERITDHRRLALKVVTGEVSPARAARFAREAEIGARISAPNVVSIVDVGIAEGGIPYLAMELAPRGSLEDRRERFGDAAWTRPLLVGIARGLSALHEAGVVHRDLKPANVLLLGDDANELVAKISDFGISRFGELDAGLDVDPAASTLSATPAKPQALTATGMMLGTPYYMAPEAVRGAKVEAPSDVFAFGILACEMLTGRAPFTVPPMLSVLAGEALREPVGLDDVRVGARLGETLRACLAEDASRRPAMRAVCDALAG